MVRAILIICLFLPLTVRAQFLGFGGGGEGLKSRVPELMEKLKSHEMKMGPQFEEAFNLGVKAIENAIEEEKLYCSGEAVDAGGKLLPPEKKQLCMRELKKHYLEAMGGIFELKKKYLEMIHSRQLEQMEEVHAKLKASIEKNF